MRRYEMHYFGKNIIISAVASTLKRIRADFYFDNIELPLTCQRFWFWFWFCHFHFHRRRA